MAVAALLLGSTATVSASRADPAHLPHGVTTPASAHVRLVQVIEGADIGFEATNAVTFAPETGLLLVSGRGADGADTIASVSTLGEVEAAADVPDSIADSPALAYDPATDALVAAPTGDSIASVPALNGEPGSVARADDAAVGGPGLGQPAGITVTNDGLTLVLDGATGRVLDVAAAAAGHTVIGTVELERVPGALSGLASGADGHLFSAAATGGAIYEFDAAGSLVSTRDISEAGLAEPQDMVIAPSADPTDSPDRTSLYVANGSDGAAAGIYEFELTATPLSASVLAATSETAALVSSIEGGALIPNSPDPSGITYDPVADRLVMTDGEIEEEKNNSYPYPGTNGWVFPRDGSSTSSTFDTTDDECSADGGSPNNREPVGIARNPADGHYFVVRDGRNLVWELDAAFSPIRCLAVGPLGVADAEGIAYGNGHLWIADGTGAEIWEIGPGTNGVFGIDTSSSGPNDDVVISNFDTASLGQPDAEGIEFDHDSGTLYIVSNDEGSEIIQVDTGGAPIRTVAVSGVVLDAARGLALAPGTDGSPMNLWIADARVDNNNNAGAIDGRIYEFALGSSGPPPPGAPDTTITGGPTGTVTETDATFTFTGSPSADAFECQLDTAGFSPCSSPQTYTGLGLGDHTFEVRALAAGVPDPSPASRTWTIVDEPPSPPPPGDNLLSNPGFELADAGGQPSEWTTDPAFSRTASSVHSGSYAGLHQDATGGSYSVYQTVPVTAGTEYSFDGWVDIGSQGIGSFKFQIKLQWRGASGKITTNKVLQLDTPTAGWTPISATDTAPAGATEVRVLMTLRNLDGSVGVDDFSFSEGP